jgi:hypothetical protein
MGAKKNPSKDDTIEMKRPSKNFEKNFTSPLEKHGCTDIICTLILILFIGVFVTLSVFAFLNGEPSNLL